jgi:hypothetical protein
MLLQQSTRRFGSWLAILAMALNALWPLLVHAKPWDSGLLIEICTSTGMKWSPADGGGQYPAQKNLVPHCAFCSLGAGRAPLPSSPTIAPMQVSSMVAVIERRESALVLSQSFFPPALPRAPPVLS